MTNQPKPEVKGIEQFRAVERFDCELGQHYYGQPLAQMVGSSTGEYALYADHAALLAFAEEQGKKLEQIKDDIAAYPAYVEYGRAPEGMLASQLLGIFNYHRDTLSTLKAVVERAEAAESRVEELEKEITRLTGKGVE